MARKNKLVMLMPTLHHDGNIDKETCKKGMPEMESYNNNTGGADAVDELCSDCDVT